MRFIVAGCLGSMGRRRIRCLKALGHEDIIGYDIVDYKKANPTCWYTDMMDEVENFLENPTDKKVDGIIVSVPPLQKQTFIDMGNKYNVPTFAEADICVYRGNYYASSSLRFYPAIQKIKELLDANILGKIYTFSYHMGQHLRDWHPGADYSNYYAAKKESGACREMFAFELSWLSMLLGTPIEAKGLIDKKLDDKDITADDVYATTVKFAKQNKNEDTRIGTADFGKRTMLFPLIPYGTITGMVLIDIVSRPATRKLHIAGQKCNLDWDWDSDVIELEYPDGEISIISYPKGKAAEGYNENITEDMYISEMENFINAIQGKPYYYPKEDEEACIKMLKAAES